MVAQCNLTLIELGEEAVKTELPVVGTWTFHQLGLLLSVVFGGIAVAISLVLIAMHAAHYSKPNEQRHIIRIIFMIPVYATISLISYKYYHYALYWEVLRDCYEAFAIASFFNLLCYYIAPTLHDQKNYFRTITTRNWVWPMPWVQCCTGGEDRGLLRKPRSGLTWFNIIWIAIFQYCVVRVVMTFVAMITQLLHLYCESSLHPSYAHVWVECINALAVTVAMYCLIQFYVQLRKPLAPHKPFLKVLCIKLVIFFSFWQVLVISFLSSGTKPVISTGPRVSYIDVQVGIPCVLLTFEMAIFAIMHIFAFPWRPYVITESSDPSLHYQGGPLGLTAYIDCFNPWDIIKASARGFRWLFVGARHRHDDASYKMESTNYDPRNNDDALPAHKVRDGYDDGQDGAAMAFYPSAADTAVSTRPTTHEGDYNDRAALLRPQHGNNNNGGGGQFGPVAPYPYAPEDQHDGPAGGPGSGPGYRPVATHSPRLHPAEMADGPPQYNSNNGGAAALPYPTTTVMPTGMPSAITTDVRHETGPMSPSSTQQQQQLPAQLRSHSPQRPQPQPQPQQSPRQQQQQLQYGQQYAQAQWQQTNTYAPQGDPRWHAR